MGLCLFANNCVIDQIKKPTAVYLVGAMRKGKNEVGLLRFCKNIKSYMLTALCMRHLSCNVTSWFSLRPHCI